MENVSDKKQTLWIVLFIVFLTILAGGIIALTGQYIRQNRANDLYEDMASGVSSDEIAVAIEETAETAETGMMKTVPEEADILEQLGIEVPQRDIGWDSLHEENEDIYAWIYVPDTTVDYPVLQHPTDNAYYLNHNIDGSRGYPGCIYTEDFNRRDFTDPHTVIYGHNLRDKTMFSSLHNFEDEALFGEDHYIFIYTEDYVYVYQVFAAYEFRGIHLLDNYDLTNEYVYEQYLKDIFRLPDTSTRTANIRDDVEVTREDRIITLSTCTSDHNSDYRFLVVGILLNP